MAPEQYRGHLEPRFRELLRAELPESALRFDEPMSRHTSFQIGGPADALVQPTSVQDLQRIISLARRETIPLTITGNGTNLLVRDGGIRGIVVKLADTFGRVALEGARVTAQCGAQLGMVSRRAAEQDLTGLEFAVGIPGTIGGAVIMNAGAFGGEMKDVVTSCSALDANGILREMPLSSLNLGYRTSGLQGTRTLVVEVKLELKHGESSEIRARMADFIHQRASNQPLSCSSAGSVFKRPPGHYVGRLVEALGLKGYRIGDAQVSEKHAGFIVNRGEATAQEVLALIKHVQDCVRDSCGIFLETELRVIGESAG